MQYDQSKYKKIKAKLYQITPVLATISHSEILEDELFGTYKLLLIHNQRSAEFDFVGNAIACIFKWNDEDIFKTIDLDIYQLSLLLTKWLLHLEKPSQLKGEFPEILLSRLATYYEQGIGQEGVYIISWEDIEVFVKNSFESNHKPIIKLIQKLKERDYHKKIRAGNILQTIVLSRSRKYGLQDEQKKVSLYFTSSKLVLINKYGETFQFDEITYNETIEKALNELLHEEIS